MQYVLSVAAEFQHGFTNADVFTFGGEFRQVVLRDPAAGGGMYSLWFTDPVAFAAGDGAFAGTVQYSSAFHEMGHNFSLNSPAAHYYGGKIDGSANAIFSEAMAQIYQHATAYEILNDTVDWGIEDDLGFEIEHGARATIRLARIAYDRYVANGAPFTSWNDPSTPEDEVFDVFMTLAWVFFDRAERLGTGYGQPLARMMALLQTFDAELQARWDQGNDTPDAEIFRATWMVAALSYGFEADLRADFAALAFPVDDPLYEQLYARLP